MTSWVVVDSGIFVATVLEETYSRQASTLTRMWIKQGIQLAAPLLFQYEVVAVMRKSVSRGAITHEEGLEKRNILLSQPVDFMVDEALLKRAYDLAARLNRPTAYDAQYLAVAERLNCEFWTADERLFNAIRDQIEWIKWLGNFEIPKG